MELDKIYNMDCLEGMKQIPDGSVDAIICDLPYGTTACAWDVIIPFDKLWEQYKRIAKPTAPIVLFGSEPFSSYLRMSNIAWYRYDWVWEKTKAGNFLLARKNPLKLHEVISVFYKEFPTFNLWNLHPLEKPVKSSRANKGANLLYYVDSGNYYQTETGFHSSVLQYPNPSNEGHEHPTQKPVDLLRYLVRTYSNEGDTILDNCMGSGTTAVACIKEKRHFIGFELNKDYYDKACQRIDAEKRQLTIF